MSDEHWTEDQLRIMLEAMTLEEKRKLLIDTLESLDKLDELLKAKTIEGRSFDRAIPFHVK